jgi:hypothetical protein
VAFETADRTGRAHAVPSTNSDRSLCGRQMLSFRWSPLAALPAALGPRLGAVPGVLAGCLRGALVRP